MIARLAKISPWGCSLRMIKQNTLHHTVQGVLYLRAWYDEVILLFIAIAMSMIGYVKRISPQAAEQVVKGGADADFFFACSAEDERAETSLNLDKTWDGIDFLFQNGKRKLQPNNDFFGAKKPLYLEEDFGYGPVMLIPVNEVVRLSELFEQISDEAFSERCATHHAALLEQEIYPFSADESLEDVEGYVTPYFKKLKALFAGAAAAGDVVLFWVM